LVSLSKKRHKIKKDMTAALPMISDVHGDGRRDRLDKKIQRGPKMNEKT
jgi:hypothetical protein